MDKKLATMKKQNASQSGVENLAIGCSTSVYSAKSSTPDRLPSQGRLEIQRRLRQIINNSDKQDCEIVENLISQLIVDLHPDATFILLESVFYFDNLGEAARALEISCIGVERANKTDDLNLQRKAHNTAGILYSRICDFEQSCLHLERALKIAIELKKPVSEFAVLCNVVSALKVMGLIQDAKSLAIRLSQYPQGTQELDYLHLQNAINGFRLAKYTSDSISLEYFNQIAVAKLITAGPIAVCWKAYVNAQRALLLSSKGKYDEAYLVIQEEIDGCMASNNLRKNVILFCALASCVLLSTDQKRIKQTKNILIGLLELTKTYALHHEEVLRSLVDLYAIDRTVRGKQLGLFYLRELNDHLINLKHRQFFTRITRLSAQSGTFESQLMNPFYQLPGCLAEVALKETSDRNLLKQFSVSNIDQVQAKALKFVNTKRRRIEENLRSASFDVAEDWAVAADFASERTGQHCFQVGNLAGKIAAAIGFSEEDVVLIEMACRLHDIGKLAVNHAIQRAVNVGKVEDYRLVRDHTRAGAKLLESSPDPVFRLATQVALHHHEWWNGCGLPDSLSGESIPLVARICLIADSYITLLHPSCDRSAWDEGTAVQQIVAMAGVQLDPKLVTAFLRITELLKTENKNSISSFMSSGRVSSVNTAKVQLLTAVEALAIDEISKL